MILRTATQWALWAGGGSTPAPDDGHGDGYGDGHGDEHHGGPAILFNTWDDLADFTILFCFTIFFALLLETLTEFIHEGFHNKPFMLKVIENVYSELTIVGLIAIPVFWFPWDEDQEHTKHIFELAHNITFMAIVVYALLMGMMRYFDEYTSQRRWERNIFAHEVLMEWKLKTRIKVMKRKMSRMNAFTLLLYKNLYKKYINMIDDIHMSTLRIQFISDHHLPKEFPFRMYLDKCRQRFFSGISKLDFFVWISLEIIMIVVLFGRMHASSSEDPNLHLLFHLFMITVAVGLCLLAFTIIYHKVLRNIDILVKWIQTQRKENAKSREKNVLKSMSSGFEKRLHEQRVAELDALFWFGSPSYLLNVLQLSYMLFAMALLVGLFQIAISGAGFMIAFVAVPVFVVYNGKLCARYTLLVAVVLPQTEFIEESIEHNHKKRSDRKPKRYLSVKAIHEKTKAWREVVTQMACSAAWMKVLRVLIVFYVDCALWLSIPRAIDIFGKSNLSGFLFLCSFIFLLELLSKLFIFYHWPKLWPKHRYDMIWTVADLFITLNMIISGMMNFTGAHEIDLDNTIIGLVRLVTSRHVIMHMRKTIFPPKSEEEALKSIEITVEEDDTSDDASDDVPHPRSSMLNAMKVLKDRSHATHDEAIRIIPKITQPHLKIAPPTGELTTDHAGPTPIKTRLPHKEIAEESSPPAAAQSPSTMAHEKSEDDSSSVMSHESNESSE